MKVTKQQLIDAAKQAGFTDKEYGLMNTHGSAFNEEIGIEEYGCGDNLLKLLSLLGVEVTEE